ncbi:RNA-binding protein [Candidatus Peregrinibacteria bacterium CG10_big_fil_rev_8_21_14_0_10_49_10]|nr:MAG: RNA-binding protein [Candidatus Peregrinibacteria bacterium CG10_big_fil_rev_8_21_14_0_10_49_10]
MTATEFPGESFLRYVLESLIEDPDQLVIESVEDDLGILHTIRVSENDMGKLIGKGGQTIKALRTLLRIIGGNTAKRINLKVLEPAAAS